MIRNIAELPRTSKESGYLDMELLRFTTAGSVDDGKSTLIGRLLYDSKSIFEDQLQAVKEASSRTGEDDGLNLALLTDGLRAEREQGITIDVAYRYFATPRRKFIIADTPGHIEYTRNMVTGASTADVAIILVDARKGILEQTKRHTYIASLLKISNIILAVNKMDMVGFSREVFETIKKEYQEIGTQLSVPTIFYIPISAKEGDNVVDPSENTPWYSGSTLLQVLETIPVHVTDNKLPARFPVQYVSRVNDENPSETNRYAGRIASGTLKIGDALLILPGNKVGNIKAIYEGGNLLQEAIAPQSVSIQLFSNMNIERGYTLVKFYEKFPRFSSRITLVVCWLSHNALTAGENYIIRQTTDETRAIIDSIRYKVDINTFEHLKDVKVVGLNEIAHITIKTEKPITFDDYSENRSTGSLVFIDETTFETVGAGMIVSDPEVFSYNI
jgi:sulfate adenylyltransferase subunit 1